MCGGIIWALEYLMEFRSMIWRGGVVLNDGCHIGWGVSHRATNSI